MSQCTTAAQMLSESITVRLCRELPCAVWTIQPSLLVAANSAAKKTQQQQERKAILALCNAFAVALAVNVAVVAAIFFAAAVADLL